MIEKIAYYQKRNDEELNINLAIELAAKSNKNGIIEIVKGLKNQKKEIENDCIKVLYEIG